MKTISILSVLLLLTAINVAHSEDIISKKDADYIFSLNRAEWEAYVKQMEHPAGWKVRLSRHAPGTGVMSFDPNTNMGASIQPLFDGDKGPPSMIIVGSYYPLGSLPTFTEDFKSDFERQLIDDLGNNYTATATYTKIPPFEGIEIMLTKK